MVNYERELGISVPDGYLALARRLQPDIERLAQTMPSLWNRDGLDETDRVVLRFAWHTLSRLPQVTEGPELTVELRCPRDGNRSSNCQRLSVVLNEPLGAALNLYRHASDERSFDPVLQCSTKALWLDVEIEPDEPFCLDKTFIGDLYDDVNSWTDSWLELVANPSTELFVDYVPYSTPFGWTPFYDDDAWKRVPMDYHPDV